MRYVVVAAPPDVTTPADLDRLPACADLVEVRLDLLAQADLAGGLIAEIARWRRLGKTRVAYPRGRLLTVRSTAEGGGFPGTDAQAARALEAVDLPVENVLLDAEGPVLRALSRAPGSALAAGRVVLSRHGSFDPVPYPADRVPRIVKRAAFVGDAAVLARYLAALREPPDPRVGRALVPFGPLGALRVLDAHAALLFGSAGSAVVPGQPPLLQLIDDLRAGEVTPDARLFGLLGTPPARSPSPALHNAVFRALGLDAVHVPLPGLDLATALTLPFQGYSVTAPFKQEALARADEADEHARAVGAANTLVRRPQGGWRALNTDVLALRKSLAPARARARFVVFGSGGYARAALVAARTRDYAAVVLARDETRGRALAEEFGAAWGGTRFVRDPDDAVLLNATPAGAGGEPVPALDADFAGLGVWDAPYAEDGQETWLARTVRARGGKLLDGLALLHLQAGGQSEAFTGRAPDPVVLGLALRPAANLVLAGLRGAGKTTVARLVARRLGRPLVDLDDEVARVGGLAAAERIRRHGLADFRRAERWAVERLQGRRGLVVATGGGVVEDPRNVLRLRALGLCVWLEVPPEVAGERVRRDPTPRPPLAADPDPAAEARTVLTRRSRRYAALAHVRIDATRPPEVVAHEVAEAWLAHERERRSELSG